MEPQLLTNRYDGRSAIPSVKAENLRLEGGRVCIQAPLGDDEDFAVYFAGGSPDIEAALLDSARSLLGSLGEIDNAIQASWAAQCRTSGLHPRNFEGELAYIDVLDHTATLHYVGTRVNTEWDERVEFIRGKWEHLAADGSQGA